MTAELTGLMTVGELSRRTGVPVKSLRAYTDWGLINTVGRSNANYRLYDAGALWCVQIIAELRGLGLTLAEIRWLFSRYPDRNGRLIGPRLGRQLQVAWARIGQQIARLEQTRRRIEEFEAGHRAELAGQAGAREGGRGDGRGGETERHESCA
jgi:MerR family transcriptional regulator, copper efflux regulator